MSEADPTALDAFATEVFALLAGLDGVSRVGLALTEGGGRRLLFTSDDRLERGADAEGSLDWCAIDAAADVPLAVAAREGRTTVGSLDALESAFPDFVAGQREAGVHGVGAAPLTVEGRVLGGFIVYVPAPPADLDVAMLDALGAGIGERLDALRAAHRRPALVGADEPGAAVFDMGDEPSDVARARRFLRSRLAEHDVADDLLDDAVLCLGELCANAIVHTHAGCRIEVRCSDGVLAVRVVDRGSAGSVRLRAPEDVETSGRGLQIVEALADRSGRDDLRCTSWFEFDLA
ncbi:ATP-binding protein [Nocardioides sp. TRM66260-LWL]|uniref:ATP-binding protein n=1 Tax=Nocardioides sp. TRM66260-LWL TaxID=2874478 RepID=UPI001CC6CE9D|nr:ATP-binding protein [Nocardioides sp. TRM66260-LWL]MBZ5735039.1 ATP-binding protein [Nocardioides sp. TRM66260-LWL]